MNHTYLIYMTDGQKLEDTALIQDIINQENKTIIIVDRTIFYPQGGGQPYDTGIISHQNNTFIVEEVRFIDGVVHHIGAMQSGNFEIGQQVNCHINKERRLLNCRLHSAGHLIDFALYALELQLQPTKGYHFPDGPYVEYAGIIEEDQKEPLRQRLELKVNEFIAANYPVIIKMVSKDELEQLCRFVPDYLPVAKPTRVMMIPDCGGIPCGGTHVAATGMIGSMRICAIKSKKGNTRISYQID